MPRTGASPSRSRAEARAKADRAHDKYVVRQYGLAPGQYAAMLKEQEGRCAICRRRPVRRRLAVDHDHNDGRVRALLCYTCNHQILGWVEGDPIAAHNLAIYVGSIAADYGPEYDPFPVRTALVEANRAPSRPRLSLRPIRLARTPS